MFNSARFRLDLLGLGLVLLGLTAVILLSLSRWAEANGRFRGSVRNQGPEGAQSLANLLDELDYNVHFLNGNFAPAANAQILFVLAPDGDFSQLDLTTAELWVQAGGTLVIAQDSNQANDLLRQFGLRLSRLWRRQQAAELRLPTLNWPWVGTVEVEARRRVRVDCARAAVHLGDCESPLLVSFGKGQGQVYVMSSLYPFSNAGLQNGANSQFVINLVQANAQPRATILFDEVHRNLRSSWLLETREGWGFMVALLALAAYFMAQRQRFGDPRPTTQQYEPERRKTAEFIASVAHVDPTHQHTTLRQHYWQRFKRQLGRRYGVDPGLPDQLFLAEMKGHVNEEELSLFIALLISLKDPLISDFDLQQWVRTVLEAGRRD